MLVLHGKPLIYFPKEKSSNLSKIQIQTGTNSNSVRYEDSVWGWPGILLAFLGESPRPHMPRSSFLQQALDHRTWSSYFIRKRKVFLSLSWSKLAAWGEFQLRMLQRWACYWRIKWEGLRDSLSQFIKENKDSYEEWKILERNREQGEAGTHNKNK